MLEFDKRTPRKPFLKTKMDYLNEEIHYFD